jgi:transcriptional regulator with XRE-family HTH domain
VQRGKSELRSYRFDLSFLSLSYRRELAMVNRKLIEARKAKGWTQTYLASRLAVSSITVSRWENGAQAPQPYCVQRLCQLFGLTDKELGFAFSQTPTPQEDCMVYKEMEKYFTFGNIKTTELILDGDGTSVYLPQHIHAHYIPVPLELPAELQAAKERIAQEQEERKAQGDAYQWNGERYNLVKFNLGRDPANEDMTLGLWFRPSDYYTFLAASTSLQDPKLRAKYLVGVEWDEALPLLAHSFSVLLTLVTSDGHTILVQRGKSMGCRPNAFDVSLAEGLSRPVDRDATSQAPDVYRCALRGLAEELGLQAPADFSPSDILFLSFAVDTEFCMWGLFGMLKIHRRVEEVLENLQRGVRDRFESRRVFSVPFTPEEVCAFVFSHEPFSPGGLVCLYHALVHEFGKEQVNKVIASF